MRPLLGVLDAPIHQPRVDLGIGPAPRDGHEQAAADVTHLPLDLPLLPARTRGARHRLHQMVGAQLGEAPVVGPLLAGEHRAHRRLHVVVDAPPADPAEEAEGTLVRLEHHLLALAREELNQLHAAVAEPHVRRLHLGRHTRQTRVLVAPVELVGLAGIEDQRHKTLRRRQQTAPAAPGPGISPHRVVAAAIAQRRKVFIDPQHRQAIPPRLLLIGFQTTFQLLNPRTHLRHRLNLALVAERRLAAPHYLANRVPGDLQIPDYLLDGNPSPKMSQTDPCDRFHNQHLLPPRSSNQRGEFLSVPTGGVNFERRLPPQGGQYSTPNNR